MKDIIPQNLLVVHLCLSFRVEAKRIHSKFGKALISAFVSTREISAWNLLAYSQWKNVTVDLSQKSGTFAFFDAESTFSSAFFETLCVWISLAKKFLFSKTATVENFHFQTCHKAEKHRIPFLECFLEEPLIYDIRKFPPLIGQFDSNFSKEEP